jgi:hypothetical protein
VSGQLQQLLRVVSVVGIDIDAQHLLIAEQHFGINGKNISLLQADAESWLRYYRGPKFDLIIDDLFGHMDGEPLRAFKVDNRWANLLLGHLAGHGTLAINFESQQHCHNSALRTMPGYKKRFVQSGELMVPGYENCIGVWSAQRCNREQLIERVRACASISAAALKNLLKFKLTTTP